MRGEKGIGDVSEGKGRGRGVNLKESEGREVCGLVMGGEKERERERERERLINKNNTLSPYCVCYLSLSLFRIYH